MTGIVQYSHDGLCAGEEYRIEKVGNEGLALWKKKCKEVFEE